jgi:glyoxylase-like metal-dependent hydrolase (beta-lactamase superfamily II)
VNFRQLLNDETACASHLLGCKSHSAFAVVDPHVDLVDKYVALAESQGVAIVAVLDTHVHADYVSGLPALVARTGATAYLPEAPAWSSTITRWPTARCSPSATSTFRRWRRPGTRSPTTPMS